MDEEKDTIETQEVEEIAQEAIEPAKTKEEMIKKTIINA